MVCISIAVFAYPSPILGGAAANTTTVVLALSRATLLSGSLTSCLPSPNVSACTAGVSSALLRLREHVRLVAADASEYVHYLDRDAPFVQMHPNDLTVNLDVMRAFGVSTYFTETSVYTDRQYRRNYDRFFVRDVTPIHSNVDMAVQDDWYPYLQRETTVLGGRVGLILVSNSDHARAVAAASVVPAAVRYLRAEAKPVVLVNNDGSRDGLLLAEDVLRSGFLPDVFIDLKFTGVDEPCAPFRNSTMWMCRVSFSPMTLNTLTLTLSNGRIYGLPALNNYSLNIPALSAALDATFYRHQAFLLNETYKAIAEDPIVGNTTVTFPLGRNRTHYPCFGGECAQGTLYTRALRLAVPGAEIALQNSGGFRGNGWAPGNVKISHMWDLLPFADHLCMLRLQGLRIWELYNLSVNTATFEPEYSTNGGNMLQSDGIRIVVDLTASAGRRLIAIEVLDEASNTFQSLERNRLYTVVTNTYFCTLMPDFSPMLAPAKLDYGESVSTAVSDFLVQEVCGHYLLQKSPYDDIYSNWIVGGRAAGPMDYMNWTMGPSMCGAAERWDARIRSCALCPAGTIKSPTSLSQCTPIIALVQQSENTLLIALVAGLAGALILAALAGLIGCEVRRRRSARNIDAAPTGGDITVVFTDIQWSTLLWGTVPASMAAALELHHRVIRECIGAAGAYEVKTVGDSFMVACKSAVVGVQLALAIQEQLLAQAWPAAIDALYAAGKENTAAHDVIDDDPDRTVTCGDGAPFCGLRVRVGMNTGTIEAVFDEVAKGYDYYGPGVNLAARVESAAQGGQVLVSRATCTAANDVNGVVMRHFAEAELHGVTGKTELIEVIDAVTGRRTFLPLSDEGSADATSGVPAAALGASSSSSSFSSIKSSTVSDANGVLVVDTMRAVLRLVKLKDAKGLLQTIARAWRLQMDEPTVEKIHSAAAMPALLDAADGPLRQLGHRVGHVMWRAKLQQQAKAMETSGLLVPQFSRSNGSRTAALMQPRPHGFQGRLRSAVLDDNSLFLPPGSIAEGFGALPLRNPLARGGSIVSSHSAGYDGQLTPAAGTPRGKHAFSVLGTADSTNAGPVAHQQPSARVCLPDAENGGGGGGRSGAPLQPSDSLVSLISPPLLAGDMHTCHGPTGPHHTPLLTAQADPQLGSHTVRFDHPMASTPVVLPAPPCTSRVESRRQQDPSEATSASMASVTVAGPSWHGHGNAAVEAPTTAAATAMSAPSITVGREPPRPIHNHDPPTVSAASSLSPAPILSTKNVSFALPAVATPPGPYGAVPPALVAQPTSPAATNRNSNSSKKNNSSSSSNSAKPKPRHAVPTLSAATMGLEPNKPPAPPTVDEGEGMRGPFPAPLTATVTASATLGNVFFVGVPTGAPPPPAPLTNIYGLHATDGAPPLTPVRGYGTVAGGRSTSADNGTGAEAPPLLSFRLRKLTQGSQATHFTD